MTENEYTIDGGSIILVNDRVCTLYPINKDSLIHLGEIFNSIYYIYFNIIDKMIPYDDKLLNIIKK